MVLFLGVCRALKAMHQYKVKGEPGEPTGQSKARRVRHEAARADAEAEEEVEMSASRRRGPSRERDQEEREAEPLMEGEVTMSQEGISPGGERAYAHRDIKPGMRRSY